MTSKIIFDNIHEYMEIKPLAKIFIDTPIFQRLRHINQLGACSYVFSSATHTRFEHSLGVYYLAGKMLDNIIKNSGRNICGIELNDRLIELIKIGGLCHDIGHGPYSHVFDDLIIKDIDNENKYHEVRSCKLIEKIVNEYVNKNNYVIENKLEIKDDEIKFIQDIINPKEENNSFIYQIVSNNLNSIDVDKFDYIARDINNVGLKNGFDYSRIMEEVRVIDNKICYPKQMYFHLCNLFTTRYYLHKEIYNHKVVKSIEFMLFDIIKLLDPILHIKDSVIDLNKFINFTDDFFTNFLNFLNLIPRKHQNNINEAINILHRLRTRDLYKFVEEFILKDNSIDIYDKFKEFKDDVLISNVTIGFISGNKDNPINNIYLYNKKNNTKCFKMDIEKETNFIPKIYQERCIKIFCKNKSNYDNIVKIFKDNFYI